MKIHLRRFVRVAAAAVAVVGLVALPTDAKASLIGDVFDLNSDVFGGPFDDLDVTVVAGTEFATGDATNVGSNFFTFGTASFIDVGATSITFFFDFGHQGTYTFTDLDWLPVAGTITGVGVNAGSSFGMFASAPTLDFTADSVTVQIDCGVFNTDTFCELKGGTQLTVGITAVHPVAAVPLPAALPLFLSALAGLGLMGWRRRRQETVA